MRPVNPFTVRARQLMALGVAFTGQALAQSSGRQHEWAIQWAGGRAE